MRGGGNKGREEIREDKREEVLWYRGSPPPAKGNLPASLHREGKEGKWQGVNGKGRDTS